MQTLLCPNGREDPKTLFFIGAMALKPKSFFPHLADLRSLRVNSASSNWSGNLVAGADLDVELGFPLRAAPRRLGLFDLSILHDLSLDRRKSDWVLSLGPVLKISTKGIF